MLGLRHKGVQTMEVRIVFTKENTAKFISHLDLNRLFARVFRRAKINASFTEGFNPHIKAVFSPPVSLGYESECEICDIKLADDENLQDIEKRLSDAMPQGIRIKGVYERKRKINEIEKAVYYIKMPFSCAERIEKLKKEDSITVIKKTKRGESEFDIAPYIKDIEMQDEFSLKVALPVGQMTVNPSLIANCIAGEKVYYYAKRLVFLDKEGKKYE